jgi:hypothetical protein
MTVKTLAARSAALRGDAERVLRSILARPQRRSALPHVLAALALAAAGAVAALLLAPHSGAENRAMARRGLGQLRRRTRSLAREAAQRASAERGRHPETAH